MGGLVVSVGAVGIQELPALASQGVDAALEVYVEPRAVVDGERALRGHVGVARVDLASQASAVQIQEGREVHERLGYL